MSAFGGKADMETGWRQDKLCVQTTMSTRWRSASHKRDPRCPFWVKSRHMQCKRACPLYPQ